MVVISYGTKGSQPFEVIMFTDHIYWLLRLRPLSFILIMVLYDFLIKIIISFLVILQPDYQATLGADDVLMQKGLIKAILESVILAPVFETIFCQWLPIHIGGFFTKKWLPLMMLSVVVFMINHYYAHFLEQIIILTGGMIFAFSFLHWKRYSLWKAICCTSTIHILGNGLSVTIAVIDIF